MTAFAPRTPSLSDVIAAAQNVRLQDLHVALPARVESFDAAKQLADVQPLLLVPLIDENGQETTARLPVIPSVPVVYPRGSGFHLVFPLAVGDNVLVVFSERSLDQWKAKGGEVNPVDQTFHSLAGAVCFPGMYPATNPVPSFPSDKLVVGKDGVNHSPAARKNDKVGSGTFTFVHVPAAGAAVTPCSMSVVYNAGDGSGPTSLSTGNGSITVAEKIISGSGNVEIAD